MTAQGDVLPVRRTGIDPGAPEFRWIAGILLALFAAYQAAYLAILAVRGGAEPIGDAYYLWLWAKFLAGHHAAQIYDPAALRAAFAAYGVPPSEAYPFAYPPTLMAILAPFGALPYSAARALATGASLLLYLWAAVGRDWRSPLILAALLAPMTTLTIVAGQTGFLSAALLVGGFRLAPSRPVLAGILFGLLTYKPQLGLLVPVALVSARLWRPFAAAAATALLLVLVTSLGFGWEVWPRWAAALAGFSRQFAAEAGGLRHLMPTVAAGLADMGVGRAAAMLVQGLVSGAAAAAVWVCFRRGATPLAVAALLTGTFLATPYALVYDMPVVTIAVLWLVADRCRRGEAIPLGETVIVLLALFFPCAMLAPGLHVPLGAVALALLFGHIVRRARQAGREERAALAAAACGVSSPRRSTSGQSANPRRAIT